MQTIVHRVHAHAQQQENGAASSAPQSTSGDPYKTKKVIFNTWTLCEFNNFSRCLMCEFLGTFILTWAHAGFALSLANTAVELSTQPDSQMTIAADAFGSGLTLAGLIYGLGHISGGHFNPGISLAFLLRGEMNPFRFFPYVITQVAGGFFAAGILDAVFINDDAHGNLGANHPAGGFTVLSAFWMEFIGSIVFQIAVLGTSSRGKNFGSHAALAAGLTIGAQIAYLAPYGGGSMNPARSIGPGVLASNPDVRGSTWIYVASPLGAALCTGIGLRWLTPKSCCETESDLSHDPKLQVPHQFRNEDLESRGEQPNQCVAKT